MRIEERSLNKVNASYLINTTNSGRMSSTNASTVSKFNTRKVSSHSQIPKQRKEIGRIRTSYGKIRGNLTNYIGEEVEDTNSNGIRNSSHNRICVTDDSTEWENLKKIEMNIGINKISQTALRKLHIAYGNKNYTNAKNIAMRIQAFKEKL